MIWLPILAASVGFNISLTVPPACVAEEERSEVKCNAPYRIERLVDREWVLVGNYPVGTQKLPQGIYRIAFTNV